MIDFDGQVALVTGGAQGQGEEEARLLASLGARVVVADLQRGRAEQVAADIGGDASAVLLDVAEEDAWSEAIALVRSSYGRLDVLVNNAGMHRAAHLLEADLDDLDAMVGVNLRGPLLGIRAVAGLMEQGGGGAIVNVASVAALAPAETSGLYGTTKAGVTNLTRSAALELGPRGIRVNSVLPGGIDTAMMPAASRPFFATIPLGRLARPGEVAAAVAFLASSASSYCTGTAVVVDGGWTLGPSLATLRPGAP